MTNQLTEQELEAKRAYHREYYRKNRKELLEKRKKWVENNRDKVAATNKRYWEKRAAALKQSKTKKRNA